MLPSTEYQTVNIKLFTQTLTLKSNIPHLILVRFGTIKIQMILSEEQLISSTGNEILKVKMWMRKSYLTFSQTVLNILSSFIPHELIVYKIHHDLPLR